MPLSGVTTVIVTGSFRAADGTAIAGKIKFSPSVRLVDVANDIVVPDPITVTLDSNGDFTVTLPATDAPQLTPAGWTWQVDEQITDHRRVYYVELPSSLGPSVDLADLAPVDPVSPAAVYVLAESVAVTSVNGATGAVVVDVAGAAAAAQAFAIQRANHTGTQLSSTISDLAEAVQDIVGAAVTAGAHITVTYSDPAGTITIAVTGLTSADLSDFAEAVRDRVGATLVAGAGIAITVDDPGDTITITAEVTQAELDAEAAARVAGDAAAVQRANHTGTQLASTISDFDTQVRTSRLDQMAAPAADVPMAAHKITGLADPTAAQDAATRAYVLAQIAALVASSPAALDTLNELATALGDDPNFATTVTNALALKAALAGATFTGEVVVPDLSISGLTGSTQGGRFVGFSAGTPTTGAHLLNDLVYDVTNNLLLRCSVAGTPGTWVAAGSTTYDALGAAAAAQAAAVQRANHTGTQLAATISDFQEAVEDRVGALVADSTTVDATYNDSGGIESLDVIGTNKLLAVEDVTGATYTFVLGDAGKLKRFDRATAQTATVPPNSSVAFPIGTFIEVSQVNAGALTVAAGAGVTINTPGGLAFSMQYSEGVLFKTGTDRWQFQPRQNTSSFIQTLLDDADAATALATLGAQMQGNLAIPWASGMWYGPLSAPGSGSGTPSLNNLRVTPLFVPYDVTIDRIAIEVTTLGASATPRLGIYRDIADGRGGYPGALLLDAGTVDGSTIGVKSITINQALTRGRYWIGVAQQGATCAMRTVSTLIAILGLVNATDVSANGYTATGVSGALSDPFTASKATSTTVPVVQVRAA